MRLLALALVLLMLAPTTAAVALPMATQPGARQEEGPPREGHHLLLRLASESTRSQQVDVRVRDGEGERTFFEDRVALAPGARVEIPLNVPPGIYWVGVQQVADSMPRSVFTTYSQVEDTVGCEGAYLFAFVLRDQGFDWGDDDGCLARTAAFEALLMEARAAENARGRGELRVPMPNSADEGAYLQWGRLRAPLWNEADAFRFAWGQDSEVHDPWGQRVPGIELTYQDGDMTEAIAGSLLTTDSARNANVTEVLRFASGEVEPMAWSFTAPSARTRGFTSTEVALTRTLFYEPSPGGTRCFARMGVQGMLLREASPVESRVFCPTWSGEAAQAWTGTLTEREGRATLPVYTLLDTSEETRVARYWFAEGVPYPVEVEWFAQPAGGPVSHGAMLLQGLRLEGEPLARDARPPPAQDVRQAPLHALEGPAIVTGRARFVLTLQDASRAAQQDPTLLDLQALLDDEEAALVAASLRVRREPGAPVEVHMWWLQFSDGARTSGVLCERAATATVDPGAAPIRCSAPTQPPGWAEDVAQAAHLARADLPARSVSFDEALTRWSTADPESAGEMVTYARYSVADGSVTLGRHFAIPVGPVPLPSEDESSHVVLDFSGRTRSESRGLARTTGLGTLPVGIADARPLSLPGDGRFGNELTPLGVGLGLAALALLGALAWFWSALKASLAALYTRLARHEILEDGVRARIHGIVSAEPGIHASAILEKLGRAQGVTEYHLGVLVREGYLTSVETTGFRRYFVTGRFAPDEMRRLALLQDGPSGRVYDIIAQEPDLPLSHVAQRAGLSLPYASRTVKRLAEAGLVDRVKDGRRVTLRVRGR